METKRSSRRGSFLARRPARPRPDRARRGAEAGQNERFVYHWELQEARGPARRHPDPGPGRGAAHLRAAAATATSSRELLITSKHSDEGEFWRYGAEIDRSAGRTLKAWSSYLWRGKSKSESADIDESGVIDIASGIFQIRRDPPTGPAAHADLVRWQDLPGRGRSDGRRGPLAARRPPASPRATTASRASTSRASGAGRATSTSGSPKDADRTPIEIHFDRSLVGVRLKLDQPL